MAQSQVNGSPATTYAYDGDGARLSKATNGVTTSYVNNTLGLSSVLQEVTSGTGGKTVSRVPGVGELDSSKAAPNDWAYVHSDAQNGRALTNSYAQVGKWWDYDPWGVVRHESGGQDSSFDYAGEQRDDETGLIYLRAHLYDPGLGRFVSRDSWGGQDSSPQSWNRFSYAENDPIDFTDPSGHKKKIKWPNGQDPDDNPKAKAAAKCKNPGQYTGSCKGGPPNKAYAADGEAQHHAKVAGQAAAAGDLDRAIAEAVVSTHLATVAGTPAAFTAAAQAIGTVVAAVNSAVAAQQGDNAGTSLSPDMADCSSVRWGRCVSGTGIQGGGGEMPPVCGAVRRGRAACGLIETVATVVVGIASLVSGADPPAGEDRERVTSLYRAVNEHELQDVINHGDYGYSPSQGGKYFARTEVGAREFAKTPFNAEYTMTLTRIDVRESFVQTHGYSFNDPRGGGPSVHFGDDVLPELYYESRPFGGVKILGPP